MFEFTWYVMLIQVSNTLCHTHMYMYLLLSEKSGCSQSVSWWGFLFLVSLPVLELSASMCSHLKGNSVRCEFSKIVVKLCIYLLVHV